MVFFATSMCFRTGQNLPVSSVERDGFKGEMKLASAGRLSAVPTSSLCLLSSTRVASRRRRCMNATASRVR